MPIPQRVHPNTNCNHGIEDELPNYSVRSVIDAPHMRIKAAELHQHKDILLYKLVKHAEEYKEHMQDEVSDQVHKVDLIG